MNAPNKINLENQEINERESVTYEWPNTLETQKIFILFYP